MAFLLDLSFTVIEAIGGLLTNSMAILSDAVHDLGDSISLGLAWYFDKLAQRRPNARYTYGYRRFSLLGALINCFILLAGSAWVLYESIGRLLDPQEVNATGMLWLAVLGVVVNGAAALKTGLGHKEGRGVNERVVSLHLLEDVLGWLAVLVVSVVMHFVELPILDPLLSLGISIFILINVFRNLRSAFRVILQGVPEEMEVEEIRAMVEGTDGVESLHDLHLWSLDSQYTVASMHVVTTRWEPAQLLSLKQTLKSALAEKGIPHATIEFESPEEHCNPCN